MDTKPIRKKLDRLITVDEWSVDDLRWVIRMAYELCEAVEQLKKGKVVRGLRKRSRRADGLTWLIAGFSVFIFLMFVLIIRGGGA